MTPADDGAGRGAGGVAVPAGRRRPMVGALRYLLAAAALAFLAFQARTLADALPTGLPPIHAVWIVPAAAGALGSILAYGEMHRQLLRRGGSHVPVASVQAITLAGDAMTSTLPTAGSAASAVYSIQALRRRGVDVPLATTAILIAGATTTALLLLAAPALLAVAGFLPAAPGLALSLGALALVVATAVAAGRPAVLAAFARTLARTARRVPVLRRQSWAQLDPAAAAREAATWTERFLPGPRTGAVLVLTGIAVYGLDFLALVAATRAVLPEVPWSALCIGWLASQASLTVQLTPGGAALAEAGLGAALLHAGVPFAPAALVVAVYRGLSWLGLAALGWMMFLLLGRRAHAHPDGAAGESARPAEGSR